MGDVLDNGAIAEEFSQFFVTCVTHDFSVLEQPTVVAKTKSQFSLETVDEQIILGLLKQLKAGNATGVDGITSRLLNLTAPVIAGSLTHLFNYSLRTGEIPSEWKSANITPVLKKGITEEVKNYRPVSVLPIVAKVFQRIVHRQLYVYLNEN